MKREAPLVMQVLHMLGLPSGTQSGIYSRFHQKKIGKQKLFLNTRERMSSTSTRSLFLLAVLYLIATPPLLAKQQVYKHCSLGLYLVVSQAPHIPCINLLVIPREKGVV